MYTLWNQILSTPFTCFHCCLEYVVIVSLNTRLPRVVDLVVGSLQVWEWGPILLVVTQAAQLFVLSSIANCQII